MRAEFLLNHPTGWDLLPEDSKRLYSLLRVLPGTTIRMQPRRDFCYHGIRVLLGEMEMLVVYKNIVEVTSDKEIRNFVDKDREMELWLLQTAYNKVPQDVYNHILIQEFPCEHI